MGNNEESGERIKEALDRVRLAWKGEAILTVEDIFYHVLDKAGLAGVVSITRGVFPVNKNQYPVCELRPDGTLILHAEFILDFKDIKESRVGFEYEFPDAVKRRIDLADSIAYRVAMHEFKLPDREGHGHGYLDEEGNFQISRDAEKANIVGRRYGLIDDAMWLWYLHSYKVLDKVRYSNDEFKRRIDWIFEGGSKEAQDARAEFPRLKDSESMNEAIRLALMINRMFFIDRKAEGINTRPAYEKLESKDIKEIVDSEESVFATEGKETRKDILPEDLVEIPRKRLKLKPERELTERQAEQRASIEIQKDIAIIIAELSVIVADYRATEGAEIQEEISQRENLLLERLRSLYHNMPVAIHSDKDYDFYSTALKELKKRRDEIYDRIEKADDEGNRKALQRLNLEAIRNTRTLTKLRVLITGMLLSGRSKLKYAELKRNAALWTLQGALNSAKMLEDELYYRAQRLRGRQKIQEIETTDWMGQLVRAFRLGALDIMVKDIEEGEEEPRVTIRQQRWLNVNTRLISIRRDLKRGEVRKAIRKIDSLIRIYGLRYIITLESYKGITADLKAIREMALGLPESHAPPREEIDRIVDKINNLAQRITYPKQLIWTDVEYKSLGSALRGKIESIAGYIPDYNLVLASKTDLEYYAEKLKIAKEAGRLSKRNRDIIERGITKLASWTRRGFVDPKQFAAIDLKPVIDLMESDDFRTAEAYCRNAVQDLGARLSDIDRIILHEKRKANSLYIAYKDKDMTKRIAEISSSIESRDLELALSQITDLRELYFNQELVEPGYIRAEKLLRGLTRVVRGADRSKNLSLTIKRIANILNEIKQDISHKHSFKITVTREDGESKKFYINPGTTALGVLNLKNLKRDPGQTLVSIGKGWIPKNELRRVKLSDGVHLVLKAKKDDKAVWATEGMGYRTEGREIEADEENTRLMPGHTTSAKPAGSTIPYDKIEYAILMAKEGIEKPETFVSTINNLVKNKVSRIRIVAVDSDEMDKLKTKIGLEVFQDLMRLGIKFSIPDKAALIDLETEKEIYEGNLFNIEGIRIFNLINRQLIDAVEAGV